MQTTEPVVEALDLVPHSHLERCLLVGYYGGGNYGDELLLELVLRHLASRGIRQVSFIYQVPRRYRSCHHDFGYRAVDTRNPWALVRAVLRARAIVVGGGGLWGREANAKTLLLGAALFVAGRVLGKPVHLLGVGYYGCTGVFGHLSARLVGWASTTLVVRDVESLANFRRRNSQTRLYGDLARHVYRTDLGPYQQGADAIDERLPIARGGERTILLGLRPFPRRLRRHHLACLERLIAAHPERDFIVSAVQTTDAPTDELAMARALQRRFPNVRALDFAHNPLAFYAWLHRHRHRLVVIAPQYHALLCAHLNGIPLFPMVYDSKVQHLMDELGYPVTVTLEQLRVDDLCTFLARMSDPTRQYAHPQP